jgi:hypothetical protein
VSADPNWFEGFFEQEWLDEIALHLPDEETRSHRERIRARSPLTGSQWEELQSGGVMLHHGSFDLLKGRNEVTWTFVRADGTGARADPLVAHLRAARAGANVRRRAGSRSSARRPASTARSSASTPGG